MSRPLPKVLLALLFATFAVTASLPALAGGGGGGGAASAVSLAPNATAVSFSGRDGGGGNCPLLCSTILTLIKSLLSASYFLTSSTVTPDPEQMGNTAAVVYGLLAQSSLLAAQ